MKTTFWPLPTLILHFLQCKWCCCRRCRLCCRCCRRRRHHCRQHRRNRRCCCCCCRRRMLVSTPTEHCNLRRQLLSSAVSRVLHPRLMVVLCITFALRFVSGCLSLYASASSSHPLLLFGFGSWTSHAYAQHAQLTPIRACNGNKER